MAKSKLASKLQVILRTFLTGWGHELASLVPATWRHWYFGRGHILLVDWRDERFSVQRPTTTGLETLSTVDLRPLSVDERKQAVTQALRLATGGKSFMVYLCLSAQSALRKTLRLPLAVEENLRQTLSFELDRQTPFKPDQVYFDYIVRERDPVAQQIKVELIVLPKNAVDEPVGQAAALGLSLNGAVLASDVLEAGARSPNFLSTTTPNRRFRRRFWSNALLLLLTLLLAGTAIALPIWQKRKTAMALNGLALEAKTLATQTQALRDQMEALANEYKFTVDQKNSLPSTFLLANQLSKLLPDDTYVSSLEVTGSDVQIQGETGSSSKLIELMENSGFLKEASHKSLLTQIPGTNVERFHIAAKTRPFPEQSGQKPPADPPVAAPPPPAPVPVAPPVPPPPPVKPVVAPAAQPVPASVPPAKSTPALRSATTRGVK